MAVAIDPLNMSRKMFLSSGDRADPSTYTQQVNPLSVYSCHIVREAEDNLVNRVERGRQFTWRFPQLALLDSAAADARRPESVVVGGTAVFVIDRMTIRTLHTNTWSVESGNREL